MKISFPPNWTASFHSS